VALTNYQTETQRLLHDPNATYFSTSDLTAYINTARNQVAIESQSIRVLVTGSLATVTVTAQGISYATATTLSVGGSGIGAVVTPTIDGSGHITAATVTAGGTSYDTPANTTITAIDPTGAGSGATFTTTLVGANLTTAGQEIYPFSSLNTPAQAINSGVNQIAGVNSIAVSWGSMKPMLDRRTWTDFQAMFRSWTAGFQGQPSVWAQFGQGVNGSVYLCPIPSQVLNMDWDVWCVPIALVNDSTAEALPYPWTDAVQYYAAYLAYSNSQRAEDAKIMMDMYTKQMKRARAMSDATFIPYPYGS
jgi:hypothetical protein